MRHIHGFLNTPLLWAQEQFGLTQFEFPKIDLTTFTPTPIPEKLRLGHQVEHIVHQLLSHAQDYEIIAHNLQVRKQKETLGEFDFFLRYVGEDSNRFRESKPIIHLELTYKFYIIDPTISEPTHRLMGPNRKDMFYKKVEKTRDKQLPLLHNPHSREVLKKLDINPKEVEQQVLFLGQIFSPYSTETPSIATLNNDAIIGYWLQLAQFTSTLFTNDVYYITSKKEWLHAPHINVQWCNHQEALLEISTRHLKKRAPIVWRKRSDGVLEKFFVVWWQWNIY